MYSSFGGNSKIILPRVKKNFYLSLTKSKYVVKIICEI